MNYQRMTQAEWDDLVRQRGLPFAQDLARNFSTIITDTGRPAVQSVELPPVTPTAPSATVPPFGARQGQTNMIKAEDATGGLGMGASAPQPLSARQRYDKFSDDIASAYAGQQARWDTFLSDSTKRINEMYGGPSTTDRLWALSRALLAPRPYRGFGGTMANVAEGLSGMAQQQKTAEQKRKEALFNLQQQYQTGAFGNNLELLKLRQKMAADELDAEAAAAKANEPKWTALPAGGSLVDTRAMAQLPVLTPDQASELARDPRNRGKQFRTMDGRVMEIK